VRCRLYHDLGTALGKDVWGLVDRGLLRTCSIGFLANSIPRRLPAVAGRKAGHEFNGIEVFDVSITGMASNVDCVRLKAVAPRGPLPLVLKSVTARARKVEAIALAALELPRLNAEMAELKKSLTAPPDRVAVLSNMNWIRFVT